MKTPRLPKPVLALEAEEEKLAAVGCTQNLTAAAAAAAASQRQRLDQQQQKQTKQSRLPLAHAAGARSRRAGAASGLCAQGGRQTLKGEKDSAQQEEEKDKVQCARNHGVACRWRVAEVESTHARAHTQNARWRRRSK